MKAAAAHPVCRQVENMKITKQEKAEVEPGLLHWMSLQKNLLYFPFMRQQSVEILVRLKKRELELKHDLLFLQKSLEKVK